MSRPVTPAERQWLNLVSFAEGTWNPKTGPQYNMMFTGRRFNDLSRHPDVVNRGGGYSSSAAGAYQFLTPTWGGVSKRLGLKDFGPQAQDLGAIQLMRQRGVDPARDPITPQTVAKLAPEWASLPTLQGRSYYGQPVKPFGTLVNFVKQQGGKVPSGGAVYAASSSSAPSSGSGDASSAGNADERMAAEMLGRLVLDKFVGSLFGSPSAGTATKGLTPPPLPTADEEVEPESEVDPSLLDQLGERLGGIEDFVSGLAEKTKVSEVLKVQDRMKELISTAQQAFKAGAPIF
jgi:muramidase (phage lysozyme)